MRSLHFPKRLKQLIAAFTLATGFCSHAALQEFQLSGARISLEEVTDFVEVHFSAMRLNRALNEWNFEVTISNKTAQPIVGPLVLPVPVYVPIFETPGADANR